MDNTHIDIASNAEIMVDSQHLAIFRLPEMPNLTFAAINLDENDDPRGVDPEDVGFICAEVLHAEDGFVLATVVDLGEIKGVLSRLNFEVTE
ncbi:hypothetical protein [Brevibacterium moorei]|uniref:hypothetical protein n=1 Tax=Brevibacterium moorei TaxID=2968457 RepID=UPI00211CC0DA|nr:hypothetical protein [Brevibacterium sp. 68QC2CO]MCQ9385102.1 hypothetical protein [Brevibacterium sp. 68QC2CO]